MRSCWAAVATSGLTTRSSTSSWSTCNQSGGKRIEPSWRAARRKPAGWAAPAGLRRAARLPADQYLERVIMLLSIRLLASLGVAVLFPAVLLQAADDNLFTQ